MYDATDLIWPHPMRQSGRHRNAGGLIPLLLPVCCQNERYPDRGQRGLGNLTVCARYGKDNRRRMLYCRTC